MRQGMDRRLRVAEAEIAASGEFDVVLINTEVNETATALLDWRIPPAVGDTVGSPRTGRNTVPGIDVRPRGITYPPIDDLLDKTGSKYALVIYSAKRARQINAYYSQLDEGLLENVGPLVETHVQEKPLSIALREIDADLLEITAVDPDTGSVEVSEV